MYRDTILCAAMVRPCNILGVGEDIFQGDTGGKCSQSREYKDWGYKTPFWESGCSCEENADGSTTFK